MAFCISSPASSQDEVSQMSRECAMASPASEEQERKLVRWGYYV